LGFVEWEFGGGYAHATEERQGKHAGLGWVDVRVDSDDEEKDYED
jgi:hypothetical protein